MGRRLDHRKLIYISVWCFCFLAVASEYCFEEDSEDANSSYDLSPHLQHVSDFSLNLFKSLLQITQEKNLFLSPYSVWNALALAYLGSAGDTKEQLKKVLKISSKEETLKKWRAVDYVYQMRQVQSNGYRFGMVNKAYFQKGIELRDCIHEVLESELELIDFDEPESASNKINDFVTKMTEGKISTLTTPSALENVKMVLVNAAFFSDLWKNPFDAAKTEKIPFYSFEKGGKESVDMMMRKGDFKHGISEELRAHVLELPYTLQNISMFIFLPPSVEGQAGFDYLIENMSEQNIEKAIDDVWYSNLIVAIPRMSMVNTHENDLKEALQSLGIEDLFDATKANLSAYAPSGGLSVTKAIHQTYLEVTEEGTEAAAATAVIGTGRSARPSGLQSFICDHPFVFIIYDKLTKNILFIGLLRKGS